jgi:hypothetical protein
LSLDSAHYYILSEAGDILQFDNDFTLLGKVDNNSVYRKYYENTGFRFLGNNKETFIVSKADNLPVAHCEIPVTASLFGTKFYYRKPNLNVVESDLHPFMHEAAGSVDDHQEH